LGYCKDLCERLGNQARALGGESWICEFEFAAAVTAYYGGNFVDALRHANASAQRFDHQECVRHSRSTGQDVRSGTLTYQALALWNLGQAEEARRVAREAVELSRGFDQPMSLAFALDHAAWLLNLAGNHEEARLLAVEAEALAIEQGLALWRGMAQAEQGVSLIGSGQSAAGLTMLKNGYEAFAASGARNVVPRYLTLIAASYLKAGQTTEAEQWLDRAQDHARDYSCYHYYSETLRLRGDLLLARDPQPDQPSASTVKAAIAAYELALDDANKRQAIPWIAKIHASLARWKTSDGG
jgi:tetratricopeptide (TPR) repeat protein